MIDIKNRNIEVMDLADSWVFAGLCMIFFFFRYIVRDGYGKWLISFQLPTPHANFRIDSIARFTEPV